MQHIKWKRPAKEDIFTHGLNPLMTEYTLCGLAFEGDEANDIEQGFAVTNRRISCLRCIQMIDECKAVKSAEIKRT